MSNVHFAARLRDADICLIRRASATSAAAELPEFPNLRFGACERVAISACQTCRELRSFVEKVTSTLQRPSRHRRLESRSGKEPYHPQPLLVFDKLSLTSD